MRPLEIEAGRAGWAANLDGTDENYRKKEELETRLDLLLADPAAFARLKAVHERPPADPLLRREIEVLYREYLPKQLDAELLKKILAESNFVEHAFNVFRPVVDGKELTDNEVRRVLIESKDSAAAAGRLGSEQGGRPASGGASEGAGEAPQPVRAETRLQGLPRHAALSERAGPGAKCSRCSTSWTR